MSTELRIVTADQLAAFDLNGGTQWPVDTFGVLAIEGGEKVVGQTAILNLPVIEGTIVVDEKKGTTLLYRLIKRVEELYRELGKTHAWAMAAEPEVEDYLERLGYHKVPVTLYTKELI
jgi:N-acetylglutamate synthase-like GNAT family acetyltransferase